MLHKQKINYLRYTCMVIRRLTVLKACTNFGLSLHSHKKREFTKTDICLHYLIIEMDDLENSRCLERSGAITNSCNKEPPFPDKYPWKHTCNHHLHKYPGKGNESDPTNTSTNTCWQYRQTRHSVPVVCRPMRQLTCGPTC